MQQHAPQTYCNEPVKGYVSRVDLRKRIHQLEQGILTEPERALFLTWHRDTLGQVSDGDTRRNGTPRGFELHRNAYIAYLLDLLLTWRGITCRLDNNGHLLIA